jgi:hypothetical protein
MTSATATGPKVATATVGKLCPRDSRPMRCSREAPLEDGVIGCKRRVLNQPRELPVFEPPHVADEDAMIPGVRRKG